ncbi:hypothetical protein GCM10022234_00420 [Aeromicrobium panaciterrae]|uniref:hypothetical protein n=1 Tax=Aeromicrobium panaciterrae TaxID=363861 RepID=UPI0031D915E2
MTEQITTVPNTCMNGCEERNDEDELEPVYTSDRFTLCDNCIRRLDKYIDNIRKNYPRLVAHLMPGSVEKDPESKQTKKPVAPLPVRVEVIDLADERHYLIGGSLPIENVRGAVGVIQRWAMTVRTQRRFTTRPKRYTIASELAVLERSWEWVLQQPWTPALMKDMRKLNSELSNAVGLYRFRPTAWCPTVLQPGDAGNESTEPVLCEGPLLTLSRDPLAIVCLKCRRKYDRDDADRLWREKLAREGTM